MKIITIRRPWAHLIVNGSKNIWTMDTGLELVIKAAGSATRLAGLQQAVQRYPRRAGRGDRNGGERLRPVLYLPRRPAKKKTTYTRQ